MGATLGQHTPSSFPKGLVVCGDVNGCYSSTTDTHLPKHHVDDVDVNLHSICSQLLSFSASQLPHRRSISVFHLPPPLFLQFLLN